MAATGTLTPQTGLVPRVEPEDARAAAAEQERLVNEIKELKRKQSETANSINSALDKFISENADDNKIPTANAIKTMNTAFMEATRKAYFESNPTREMVEQIESQIQILSEQFDRIQTCINALEELKQFDAKLGPLITKIKNRTSQKCIKDKKVELDNYKDKINQINGYSFKEAVELETEIRAVGTKKLILNQQCKKAQKCNKELLKLGKV